ncbi:MAG: LamG domain-containing protein [Planctomycetes bacterium]|nr:LamG domain-containing protein [Planctomycetota bacterium]
MVAKDPSDRFQSMQEVIERLERLSTSNVAQKTASSNRMKKDGVTSNTHLRDVNATEIAGTSEGESNTGQQWRLTRILVSFIMGVVLLGIALSFSTVLFRPTDPIRVSNETVLEFDGRSSYGVVSSLEPMKGESYTLEAIVEPYEFRTSNVISWLGPDWMAIFLTNDGHWGVARRWQGRSYVQVAGLSSQLNKKVHLAGVFLGSDLRLYIDGKLTETESIEFQLSETTGGLFIGGTDLLNLQDERFFRGTIDSISITRGVRYREVFDPPNTLKPDGDSIAVFQFTKPQGKQNRSLDGKWIVELVNTKWNRRK